MAQTGDGVCPHCGAPLARKHTKRHIKKCWHNPTKKQPIVEFLHAHARNGRIMNRLEYDQMRPYHLPPRATLESTFGNWPSVAEWAGLGESRHGNKGISRWDSTGMNAPNPGRISNIRSSEWTKGMPCMPALRCVRAWEIRSKSYQPVGWEKVLVLR